ncbi:MAG: hypothetical protein PVG89_10065 [Gammaproteobacteria bacterium]|jgi:hypothetical protein
MAFSRAFSCVTSIGMFAALSVALVLWPIMTAAQTCFSASPSKNAGIPVTAHSDIRDLSDREYQHLTNLFKAMEDHWSGTVQETVCRGSPDSVKKDVHDYTVEPEIEFTTSKTLELDATWHSKQKKTSRVENLELILTKDRLRLDVDAASGDVKLIKVADNFLVFLDKNNIRNPSGGVVTQEIVHSFALASGSLTIEYKLYTNGLLVSFSTWLLSR